ncbi:glycosyltransferase family 2 protein [Bifidobacterium leontopitheci]|nr:glycosyltransferase family 2 protein [Bifidobacterium leontopitheci]
MNDCQSYAPALSIIIPAYNVQAYLERCVTSLASLRDVDMEILLIDDGSTDGTSVLCDELAHHDSRVHAFHQNNRGVSAARNNGLEHARGTWIGFVDADDCVDPASYARMFHKAMSSEADLLIYGYQKVFSDQASWTWNAPAGEMSVHAAIEMMSAYDGAKGYLWNKLYRHTIIDKWGIRCDERITMCEDLLFNIEYVKHCSRIAGIDESPYKYMENLSSSLHDVNMDNAYTCLAAHEQMLKLVPTDSKRDIAASSAIMAEEFLMRTYCMRDDTHRHEYWTTLRSHWKDAMAHDIPGRLRIRIIGGRFMPSVFYPIWNRMRGKVK